MLTSFNLPSKNLSQEKQMAMMRNYLNQLKDETETELYDIKWDNLSKSLKDKFNALDGEIVAQGDSVNYLQANLITATEIASKYATFDYLDTQYVYTGSLVASQITSGTIDTGLLNVGEITAGCVNADLFTGNYISAGLISADNITAGTLAANRISGDIMRTSQLTADAIVAKFAASNTAVFGRVNIGLSSSYESNLRFLMSNNTYAPVKFAATSTPNRYNLVVDLPS